MAAAFYLLAVKIMKKSKRLTKIHPERSPYETKPGETIEDWYERYKADGAATIEQSGKQFFRIISIAPVETERGDRILCCADQRLRVKLGDICVDENGQAFPVVGIEMPYYTKRSEWTCNTKRFMLAGKAEDIGEYLCCCCEIKGTDPDGK